MKPSLMRSLRRSVSLALVSSCYLATTPGCGCTATPLSPADKSPANPAVSSVTNISSTANSLSSAAMPFALQDASPLLETPSFTEIKKAESARDFATAAQLLEQLFAASPPPPADRPRWLYQLGKLAVLAKQDDRALRAFTEAAQTPWPLASYASYAAAQAALRLGRPGETLRLLSAFPEGTASSSSAHLLAAEAYEKTGNTSAALALWRTHLASAKHPARWAEISIKTARALLLDSASPDDAREALHLARRVRLEAAGSTLSEQAPDLEKRALVFLPYSEREAAIAPSHEDELHRLTALFNNSNNTPKRLAEADKAMASLGAALSADERNAELGCRVAMLTGQIKTKRKAHAVAADAYGEAIVRCTGDALVTALFQGGKASQGAGRPAEAMTRFEQLEQHAPQNPLAQRLADDARLRGAEAALASGDEARFSSMLETIADTYPEGDMISEGLFRLALHRIGKGDWASALGPLEQARRLQPREHTYGSAGRSSYFHARALLKIGSQQKAIEELKAVINSYPLSYYMLLAYARLSEVISSQEAADTLAQTLHRQQSEDAAFSLTDCEAFHTPGFARARELLHQGELELAKAEITTLELTGSDSPKDVLWALAFLYDKAGALSYAHTFARNRLTDWLDHYPTEKWRAAWQIAYPKPYSDLVVREATQSGIPLSLAYAIMREESAFEPTAVSPSRAFGLMQLVLPTASQIAKHAGLAATEESLKMPAVNIALGCRYLAHLHAQFPSCTALTIASYNAGPGASKRWLSQKLDEELDLFVERIPYEETRNYTKRVLTSYIAYLFLYEPQLLPGALAIPLRIAPSSAPPTSALTPPPEAPNPDPLSSLTTE